MFIVQDFWVMNKDYSSTDYDYDSIFYLPEHLNNCRPVRLIHFLPTDMIPDVYRSLVSLLPISSAPLFKSDLVIDTSIDTLCH